MRLSQLWVLWGGVITSCSNGSDSTDDTPPEDNEDVPEDWNAITVGDIEKYDGQNGTSSYTVTKNNDGSITISHDAAMAKYASCSFKPKFSDNNTLYTKITNNSDVEATVQIQVNKAGTEANGYEPTPTITAVYVDGEKQENASAYGVELKIPANESVVIANMFDLEKNPDTVAISLNSQEKIAGTVEKGNITVSGISMKTVTDEKELATAEEDKTEQKPEGDKTPDTAKPEENKKPDATNPETPSQGDEQGNGDKEEEKPENPGEPAKETVIYKLDFSGAEPPAKNYMSDEDNAKFVPNEGVKINGAWAEFAFVPTEMPNLKDANYVKVNFKCSEDAAFAAGDNDNNKFMLGGYKYSDMEKKDTNVSWTCFLKGGTDKFPTDFTTVEKKINWEQKYEANGNPIDKVSFDDIGGLKIWDCNFEKGTLYIKSIEFIKK